MPLEVGLDLSLQRRGIPRLVTEDHVAARDERGDIRETELAEELPEPVHLDPVTPDVDSAEEGNVAWHVFYSSRTSFTR